MSYLQLQYGFHIGNIESRTRRNIPGILGTPEIAGINSDNGFSGGAMGVSYISFACPPPKVKEI